MTSGRSMKNVMRRKPSASHCVKKPSFEAYSPISFVFLRGSIRTTVSSANASGTDGMVRCAASSAYSDAASVRPSSATDSSRSSSPSRTSGARASFAAGLRRTASFARTRAKSSRISTSRSTVEIRNAGGV